MKFIKNDLKNKPMKDKTTTFVLKHLPFDVMETGEKLIEFREVKPWVTSRLYDKKGNQKVTHIKFVRGYGKNARLFTSKIESITIQPKNSFYGCDAKTYHYSKGLKVELLAAKEYYLIYLEKPIINHGTN